MRWLLLALFLATGPAYAQQPELVADLAPGPASSDPRFLGEVNGRLILVATDEDGDRHLWSLSNSALAPVPDVALEGAYHAPEAIGIVNNRLVFAQYLPDDLENQVYWSTDGQQTQRLDTLVAAGGNNYPFFSASATIDGVLYFAAGSPEHGGELWATDGLTTWLVADIVPGPDSSFPRALTVLDGRLMFHATTPEAGRELWTLDPDGPRLVQDINPGPGNGIHPSHQPFAGNTHVYFNVQAGNQDLGVWRSDADAAEQILEESAWEFFRLGTQVGFVTMSSEQTVYVVEDQGVEELFDVRALPGGDNPGMWEFVAWEDTLLFSHQAEYPEPNCDGLSAARWDAEHGAQIILSGMTACPSDDPGEFTPAGDRLAFRANSNEMGTEPALYDGATVQVYELTPGIYSSYASFFTPFEDAIYFVARTPELGRELWVLPAPTTTTEPAPSTSLASPPFPNPARDRLHLPLDASAPMPRRLDVFDVAGRRVRVVELPADAPRPLTLDLRGIPSGNYWVKVLDGDRNDTHPFTVVR